MTLKHAQTNNDRECRKQSVLRLLQNRPNHLIADALGFGNARCEEGLNFLEPVPVGGKIAEGDAISPGLGFEAWLVFWKIIKKIQLFGERRIKQTLT